MNPMLSRKIIKRQQYVSVFGQALAGLWILDLIGVDKAVERLIRLWFGLGPIALPEVLLGLGLQTSGFYRDEKLF
jgi:hypothetical protein